jgi:predicted acylesterase/phospholipase RssA
MSRVQFAIKLKGLGVAGTVRHSGKSHEKQHGISVLSRRRTLPSCDTSMNTYLFFFLSDLHAMSRELPQVLFLCAGPKFDVVLSSGFLAFAPHSGFLQAVEDSGVSVGGVMGTSAGALAGSLWCAGYPPEEVSRVLSTDSERCLPMGSNGAGMPQCTGNESRHARLPYRQVARELSRVPPVQLLRPCWQPWRGGFISLEAVVERLRQLLPPTFEELEREFAVGVVTRSGRHVLLDSGPLPEAVAASAAIPVIFAPVDVPGTSCPLHPF